MSEMPPQHTSAPDSSGALSRSSLGCQPFSVWLQISSGTIANDAAMSHLRHAASCSECSKLLAKANNCLSTEVTPEEEALLASLKTASLAGQFQLAQRIHRDSVHGRTEYRSLAGSLHRKWYVRIVAWGGLAVCVAVAALLLLLRQPSDAALLASAYDQQRPSDLRLRGSVPGPLASSTRGNTPANASNDLLILKLHTQQNNQKRPNDPRVRQMLGRIALVEHDGDSARTDFEMAEALDASLPGLKFDLASAYFEIAESTDQRLQYAKAADLFSQYLADSHQQDSVALFNRGLCWERQAVPTEAVADFEAALKLEKDPKWRTVIQDHLVKLRKQAFPPASSNSQPLLSPTLASETQDLPGNFEVLLSVASREWLPRRDEPQIDRALRTVAALGLRHNDHWLEDMLRPPNSPSQRSADQALALTLTQSVDGKGDQALTSAKQAMRLYQRIGNHAGYLRAEAEHLYLLQRVGFAQKCLREAEIVEKDRQVAGYAWLRNYVYLETSAAYAMIGDTVRARAISASAATQATEDGLPLAALRARSFEINDDTRLEHFQSAWQAATSGLETSTGLPSNGMPRFQLLFDLSSIAKTLNLFWTQTALANAAAGEVSRTMNRQTWAYAMEELALDDLQIGDLVSASNNFRAADALLGQLGDGPAVRRYAADWQTDRALLVARNQGPLNASKLLARQEPIYTEPDAIRPRLHYRIEYADLLRQSHQADVALRIALEAIADAEARLTLVRTEAERRAWEDQTHKAYEVLVADLSGPLGDPALALRAQEWMESAPYRRDRFLAADFVPDHLDRILPPLPVPQSGHLIVVIARVLDSYVAWSITGPSKASVVEHRLVVTPAFVSRSAGTLHRLCADPRSSPHDIAVLGNALYTELLAPFDDQIVRTPHLDLDVETSLAGIPFAVLQQRDHYLGLEHTLNFLPAWWVLQHSVPSDTLDQASLPAKPHVAILHQLPLDSEARIPVDYDESSEIVELFPEAQVRKATLHRNGTVLKLGSDADIKILLSHADLIHYVGHGLLERDTASTAVESPSAMNLSPGSLPHCRLAVLAACSTLAEREESAEDVPSFARIILAAGASHVLATQWDVDSRMTSRLMVCFYSALASHQNFGEALRRAQQSVEADPSSQHPYFWSGFQLIGD